MFILTLQLNLYFKNILCKNDCMSIFVTELYDSDICFKKVFKIKLSIGILNKEFKFYRNIYKDVFRFIKNIFKYTFY